MRFLILLLDRLQGVSGLLRWFGVSEIRMAGFKHFVWRGKCPQELDSTTWVHASSLGELEMVRPLIDDFLTHGERLGVSVFSESALPGLMDLSARCVYAGLSPREEEWKALFQHFKVKKVVLSKYDLWPGLLWAASELNLSVLVVNAEYRRSVFWVKRAFEWTRSPLPRLWFFANSEKVKSELKKEFPTAQILNGVDPRWERVTRRNEDRENAPPEKRSRVQTWFERWQSLPKPWVLVGSAWKSDLIQIAPALKEGPGTLIVVPHSLNPSNLSEIQGFLNAELPGRFLVVKEMGVLVELYAHADRAFVGGGFERGIHSTLEPAIAGLPVCCGPKKVCKFGEARELQDLGVLTVCSDSEEIKVWLGRHAPFKLSGAEVAFRREQYRSLLEECLRIR